MFLGVDGGGTKTAVCLIDQQGAILARIQVASIDYFSSPEGVGLVARVLSEGVSEVCDRCGITPEEIQYAFIGIPTYGEASSDVAALDAAPRAALGHDRYRCGNDMVCGWAGSLGAADGINVISGTGSMTYGERGANGVRVGGWGELFGDEGSAYWIAARGLGAFSRMSDGRLEPGPLLDVLRSHLNLQSDLDLVDVVLNRWHGARSEIAALSRQVDHAAQHGDTTSAGILADAGTELAQIVDCTRMRLGFTTDETVPVSYSGSVFRSTSVRQSFTRELDRLPARYELRAPLYQPDAGAALYAAKLSGSPLNPAALQQLRAASPAASAN